MLGDGVVYLQGLLTLIEITKLKEEISAYLNSWTNSKFACTSIAQILNIES